MYVCMYDSHFHGDRLCLYNADFKKFRTLTPQMILEVFSWCKLMLWLDTILFGRLELSFQGDILLLCLRCY